MVDGTAQASDVVVAGIEIARLERDRHPEGKHDRISRPTPSSGMARAPPSSGALSPLDGGYRVRLDTVDLKQGTLAARLTAPSTIEVQGQNVAIDNLLLDVGGGQVGVRGTVAEKLNLAVSIKRTAAGDRQRDPSRPRARRHDRRQRGGHRNAGRAGCRIRSEGAGDCRRGASPGRPQHDQCRCQGHLQRPEAQRQCLSSSAPKGLRATATGAVPLDGGALALDVNLQGVSACRAECSRAWPGAWRHDLRIRQDCRLAGASRRRTSTSAAIVSARPLSTISDCRRSRRPRPEASPIRCRDAVVGKRQRAGGPDDRGERPSWIWLVRAPTSRSTVGRRCRSPTASSPIAARRYRAPSRSPASISGSLEEASGEGHGLDVRRAGGRPRGQSAADATSRSTPPSTATPSRSAALPQPSAAAARSARQERFRWPAACPPTSASRSTMPAMPTAIWSLRP